MKKQKQKTSKQNKNKNMQLTKKNVGICYVFQAAFTILRY